MKWQVVVSVVLVFSLSSSGWAIEPEEWQKAHQAFSSARELEQDGKVAEAFRAYLETPGGEHAAARLARSHPEVAEAEISRIESDRQSTPAELSSLLVKAELELARGENARALGLIRAFASAIAPAGSEKGWEEMTVPSGYYPVEPPTGRERGSSAMFSSGWQSPALPFQVGPGSHVDNWLIRRFIALEAWDDAAAEFDRLRRLHEQRQGPDPLALQFGLDYAFFQIERNRKDEALSLLAELFLKLDLDRRLGISGLGRHFYSYANPIGISHDEFIRLGYGAFKTAGREAELIEKLKAADDHIMKRVLAKIRIHEGDFDEALQLELDYIEAGGFSPVATAIRQGLVYESLDRHAEAVAAFEKALELKPEAGVNLPVATQANFGSHQMAFQMRIPPQQLDALAGEPVTGLYRENVLERLEKTYEALGRPEMVLRTTLKRWDANPSWANTLSAVESLAQLAKNTDQEAVFSGWADAARKAGDKFSPVALANLAWARNDMAGTLAALGKSAKHARGSIYQLDDWIERMNQRGGRDQVQRLLETLIANNPDVGRYRLELLNISEEEIASEVLIEQYEALFAPDAEQVFSRGKGIYNQTQFENYFDLAHRLMRLYLKTGQQEKMEALGLRMAGIEKPFGKPDFYNDRGHPEKAMAFLISQAGEKTLIALEPLLTEESWPRGRKHLAWVRAGGIRGTVEAFHEEALIPWHGPKGAGAIVSDENVLDLARNENLVFAGQPWGVSVYDFDGKLLRRIPIGEAALNLAANEEALWIGTAIGLRRVDLQTWEVSQLSCDQEVPEEKRVHPDYNLPFHNGVTGLAFSGSELWIGTRRNVRRLNTDTMELRIFSQRELGVKSHADWEWFLFEDDGKVWANGDVGSHRYDPETDSWAALDFHSPRGPARVIGRFDGKLWADVYVNEELRHRPGILDPETLRAEPVRIANSVPFQERTYLSDIHIYGRFEGRLVFGPGRPAFVYNPETNRLDPLPENWDRNTQLEDSLVPAGHRHGYLHRRHNGTILGDYKTWLPLPGGRVVLGQRHSRNARYLYPHEDWPFVPMVWEMPDDSGGLHWFEPGEEPRRISQRGLAGDTIFDAVPGETGIWLCTNAGISLADPSGEIVGNFDRDHGLPGNRSTSVTRFAGKTWFGCRHDDHHGALVAFDPERPVFTTLTVIDGLSSNAVESVAPAGEELRIRYGMEYRRYGDSKYHQYPASNYNPATGEFSKRPDEPTIVNQERAKRPSLGPMPVLGGSIISKREIGEQTWLLGTRGILMLPKDVEASAIEFSMPELKVSVEADPRLKLLSEAREIRKAGGLDYEAGIAHENPLVVADTLTNLKVPLKPEQVAEVSQWLESKTLELRSTAATLLYRTETLGAAEALGKIIDDPYGTLRSLAAIALTRHGEALPVEALADTFHYQDIGNPPWGAESNFGIVPGRDDAHYALAARGEKIDAEVLKLLMRFPPRLSSHDHKERTFPKLGDAVRANPELARVLLTASNTRRGGDTDRDFARDVFRFSGPGVLPILHEALKSEDRVIRANAALGCGAVGDVRSADPLLAAFDLESGLSKGAIVWALGEIEASQAIPRLTDLYLEARLAEKRRYASGMQYSQMAVVNQQQRRELASLDNLQADWDELKASAERADAPADPRHEEPLLSPRMVLDAVAKIGPEQAQPFYRSIAADKQDSDGRLEAARGLAQAPDGEREASVTVLKMLAANSEESRTQAAAGVSLLLLGENEVAEATLRTALGNRWNGHAHSHAISEMAQRVEDRSLLRPLRDALQSVINDRDTSGEIRGRARALIQ